MLFTLTLLVQVVLSYVTLRALYYVWSANVFELVLYLYFCVPVPAFVLINVCVISDMIVIVCINKEIKTLLNQCHSLSPSHMSLKGDSVNTFKQQGHGKTKMCIFMLLFIENENTKS